MGSSPWLLGRDRELAEAAAAVAAAGSGATRSLGLLGEAGIGKSALLGAIAERGRAGGLLVLQGRAAEHERDVPFGLVIDALDDHVATLHPRRIEALGPDLGAVLPAASTDTPRPAGAGAAERFRYHRALRAPTTSCSTCTPPRTRSRPPRRARGCRARCTRCNSRCGRAP